ncbi:MAG: alpha-hydroxy-acid oxidizing protein [Bacillota bacterium]
MVSNHEGRSPNCTPGTAEDLPEIVSAVKGKVKIYMDSGIRSGEDVFKALVLRADAVLVGRVVAIAAIGEESEGVILFLDQYRRELKRAILLTGCGSIASIGAEPICL